MIVSSPSRRPRHSLALVGFLALPLVALSACDSSGGPGAAQDQTTGLRAPLPSDSDTSHTGGSGGAPAIGPDCRTSDTSKYCLALNYVVYKDPSTSASVVSAAEAVSNVEAINSVWASCGIAFQIDRYQEVTPSDFGLTFNTANSSELTQIRRASFADTQLPIETLLVVTTGKWNRSGSLGSTGANAWTQMPGGSGPFGAILESTVATYPNIIAHELGHSLNLDHGGGSANLMNPIIYTTSTGLTSTQCNEARLAAKTYWSGTLR